MTRKKLNPPTELDQVSQAAIEEAVQEMIVPPPTSILRPKHARILLSNQIDDFSFTMFVACVEEKLKRLKILYLMIDSPGGCAKTMKSFISYIESLKSYGIEVVTIGMNRIASAALPVFMTGDRRYCLGTEFMEHFAYYPHLTDSTEEDLQHDMESIKKDMEYVLKYSTKGSKLTATQFLGMINAAYKKTLEFGPEEAYEWGFLTHDCPPPRVGGPLTIIKYDDDDDKSRAKKKKNS